MRTQSTFNSVLVSTAPDSLSSEGFSNAPQRPSSRHHDEGLPQSWPAPSDFPSIYSKLDEADEDFEANVRGESPESPGPFDSPPETHWSPAAAFLSSLSAPSHTPPEGIPGYVLGSTIGHGVLSTVKEATSPSGQVVAVKIIRCSAFATLPAAERAIQRSRLSHEARIWRSLSHENILPLFDSYKIPEALYLVTLYCPTGSLLDILKREGRPALEQTDVGYLFRQIVKALQYMHETMGLVHGDVKLENVLVDECGVCRLADFGLTRRIGCDPTQPGSGSDDDDAEPVKRKEKRGRRTGTDALPVHLSLLRHGAHGAQRHRNSSPLPTVTPPTHPDHVFLPGSLPYAAPELLLPHSFSAEGGRSSRPTAHPAQDMWALGVLLYTLLTGSLPFRDQFEPRLQMKILRGTYDMPPGIGQQAESVLKGCLQRDICERWTISSVDNAAWGIGYGNVELGPALREEQRSQPQDCPTPTPPEDPIRSPSPWRVGRAPHVGAASSGHHPPFITIRGQSRSPSPSIAPRTPDDDEFDVRRPGRHSPREESGIQIVEGGSVDWDSHDTVFDDEDLSQEGDVKDLPLHGEDLGDKKRADRAPGRPDAPTSYTDMRKSQDGSRTWTLNDLTSTNIQTRNR